MIGLAKGRVYFSDHRVKTMIIRFKNARRKSASNSITPNLADDVLQQDIKKEKTVSKITVDDSQNEVALEQKGAAQMDALLRKHFEAVAAEADIELDVDVDSLDVASLQQKYGQLLFVNNKQKSQFNNTQEAILALRERIGTLVAESDKKSVSVSKLKEVIEKKNNNFKNLQSVVEKKNAVITNLRDARERLLVASGKIRTSMERLRKHEAYFRESPAINRYLKFARRCYDSADVLAADVYVAHGVQALSAATSLRAKTGGKAVCDCIEIPAFSARAIQSRWHPVMLGMIDASSEGFVRSADHLITVGWELGEHLKTLNSDVRVLPNYRCYEELNRSNYFRQTFDLPENVKIVLCISIIASGFEDVIHAIKLLPENVHLVTMGKFAPQSYKETIEKMVSDLKLDKRIHFHDPVDYSDLASVAGGADIGLIVRDPEIPNNYVSLPNRVFDYMASGLPTISPEIPDIKKIIIDNEFGVAIPDTTAESWAKGIADVLNLGRAPFENAEKAAKKLSWETLEPDLPSLFDNPESVTFLGFTDLTKNNRTMRIATSLVKYGIKVKIAGPVDMSAKTVDGVEFINIEQC